ncbi:MAG: hypothetical protein ACFE85_11575 [Candidatus Hodarchaeota archaeon]
MENNYKEFYKDQIISYTNFIIYNMISKEIQDFLLKESLRYFLKYVKVWTTSSEDSNTFPSNKNQIELVKLLKEELEKLGLVKVTQDEYGYVYAY